MIDIAYKDFEHFCADNSVKPTNQKADFYLAGYYKGQNRLVEKACKWLYDQIDMGKGKSCRVFFIDTAVERFRKAMEDKQ